jgi:hypothetical protein
MPYEELVKWYQYFEKRPVGWREDSRAAKIIQAQGVKASPEELFSSLRTIGKQAKKTELVDSLKNSSFFTFMAGAKGGDALPGMERE